MSNNDILRDQKTTRQNTERTPRQIFNLGVEVL
jgi:hypothetical protein